MYSEQTVCWAQLLEHQDHDPELDILCPCSESVVSLLHRMLARAADVWLSYFALHCCNITKSSLGSPLLPQPSSSLMEVRAGTEAEAMGEHYWLALHGLLSLLK